jgi:zinc/manganese transport system substrate-binding protein
MVKLRSFIASLLMAASLSPALAQTPDKLPVVASFSILGDFVRQVGGDRISLDVLVQPGGDTHVYSPTPSDAKKLTAARVIFVNGIRFEGWMDRLVRSSGAKAAVVTATSGITPLIMINHQADRGLTAPDPHAWQNIANAKIYVANVRDALAAADPAGAATYKANAQAYLGKLDGLEQEVIAAMAKIPPERRRIITSHDAFGYFGAAYGLQLISPQGISTDSEASAQDVARIIRQIKQEKIPAVFVENITDPRLSERIAQETGAKMGGTLYSDSLSPPDGPAGTYIDMVRHNIRELTKALGV